MDAVGHSTPFKVRRRSIFSDSSFVPKAALVTVRTVKSSFPAHQGFERGLFHPQISRNSSRVRYPRARTTGRSRLRSAPSSATLGYRFAQWVTWSCGKRSLNAVGLLSSDLLQADRRRAP